MPLSSESTQVVDKLEDYITELHVEWKVLLQLFGSGDQQSKFLNRVAACFFDTTYRTFIRDIILGVARLTDPLKTGGQENLVLDRLADLSEVNADVSLKAQVTAKLAEIKTAAEPFRAYRHKHLAHLDLQVSLQDAGDILPGIKKQNLDSTLALFVELLNLIEGRLRNRAVDFKGVATPGDAQALLRNLEDAQAFRQLSAGEKDRLRKLVTADA